MLAIRLIAEPVGFDTLVLPLNPGDADRPDKDATGQLEAHPNLVETTLALPEELATEARALAVAARLTGRAGEAHLSIRPLRQPQRLVLLGVGDAGESQWRAAGASLARRASGETSVTVAMPAKVTPGAVRGLVEGLLLASYRFRMSDQEDSPDGPRLAEVVLAVGDPDAYRAEVEAAEVTGRMTRLARDLINMPSSVKSPQWFADQIQHVAAELPGVDVRVREPDELAAEGFDAILAVGAGSVRGPRLLELSWRPTQARTHVVLVGKGITFDTGGISIKPREAMKLMRKDMAGAAAVLAATLGAAALKMPVRITTLTPLAENMVSGSAFRPGDVIRHYGGLTSETTNSDAEGRLVLADALAYAVRELTPDVLVDLATLTGANAVALGKRTGALYADNDRLAGDLLAAAAEAGESAWRMPLPPDYVEYLRSDVADLYSAPDQGGGSVMAALYLREFVGDLRERWVHVDMSAPSWAEADNGELTRGGTGWGVRSLLRWLATVDGQQLPTFSV